MIILRVKSSKRTVLLKIKENSFNMDVNAESASLRANGLSQIEILVLMNELFALRDRVTSLERQLSNIKQCTDCQMDRKLCAFCQELHPIQHCDYFKYLQVSDRWSVAKKLNLCYRCLEKSHHGRYCPQSRKCGVNRCRLTHSALLHDEKRRNRKSAKLKKQSRDTSLSESSGESKVDEPHSASPISSLDLFDDEYLLPEGESNRIKAPSGGNDMCNLDPFNVMEIPHAGVTEACDEKADCQNIDELNRLAMLGEKEVPFDLIFAGSPGDGSKRLQSVYVTPVPFGENITPEAPSAHGSDNNDQLESGGNQLDSSNNEYVDPALKHPCPIEVVVNFNHENTCTNDETDSSDGNTLDPIAPGGYDPFRPSGGNIGITSSVPPMENENIRFAPDRIDINARLYDAGMFYNKCRMPEDHQKRAKEKSDAKFEKETPSGGKFQKQFIDTQAEVFSGETEFGLPSSGDVTSKPPDGKMDEDKYKENFGNVNIVRFPSMSSGTISGLEPTFAVKLEQLIQKCGQEKILDVLTDQLHSAKTPAPPEEEQHKETNDLSVWLMPTSDPGGS